MCRGDEIAPLAMTRLQPFCTPCHLVNPRSFSSSRSGADQTRFSSRASQPRVRRSWELARSIVPLSLRFGTSPFDSKLRLAACIVGHGSSPMCSRACMRGVRTPCLAPCCQVQHCRERLRRSHTRCAQARGASVATVCFAAMSPRRAIAQFASTRVRSTHGQGCGAFSASPAHLQIASMERLRCLG